MKVYEHPSIKITQPAPGHFVLRGHNPQSGRNERGERVVPLEQCYITPEIPDDALIAILEERGARVIPPTKAAELLEILGEGKTGLIDLAEEARNLIAARSELRAELDRLKAEKPLQTTASADNTAQTSNAATSGAIDVSAKKKRRSTKRAKKGGDQ
jgi:hypothetical protein